MADLEHAPTRQRLGRALVMNAMTKPTNVLVPVTVAVVGIVISAAWLIILAVIVYAALAAVTFFDEDEAKAVADRFYHRDAPRALARSKTLAPAIAGRLDAAVTEQRRIEAAISSSALPFTDLGREVNRLTEAMHGTADRAQVIHEYLSQQDPQQVERRIGELERAGTADATRAQTIAALREQLDAHRELNEQLERYDAEMEHTVASLGAVHAQIVRASVAGEAEKQHELAGEVRSLREEVDVLSEAMREVYAQTKPGL